MKKLTVKKKETHSNNKQKKLKSDKKTYYIYILECANRSLYTGITTDIDRRFEEHKTKMKGAKYTKAFAARRIVAAWKTPNSNNSRSIATRIECNIKGLKRVDKQLLVLDEIKLKNIFDDKELSKVKRIY